MPRALRDQLGLAPGPVEIQVDGAGLRIEPVAGHELVEREGRMIIPTPGYTLTDDDVHSLRLADQR